MQPSVFTRANVGDRISVSFNDDHFVYGTVVSHAFRETKEGTQVLVLVDLDQALVALNGVRVYTLACNYSAIDSLEN